MGKARNEPDELVKTRMARVYKYLSDGVSLKQACKNVNRSPGWYRNNLKRFGTVIY